MPHPFVTRARPAIPARAFAPFHAIAVAAAERALRHDAGAGVLPATGLEAFFARQLQALPAERRAALHATLPVQRGARAVIPEVGAVDLGDRRSVIQQLVGAAGAVISPRPLPARTPTVQLQVAEVRCLRTTREAGADEVQAAAVAFDGRFEHRVFLPARAVGSFRKGDVRALAPPLAAPALPLRPEAGFQGFFGLLLLGEIDRGGGFSGFAEEVFRLLQDDDIVTLNSSNPGRELLGAHTLGIPAFGGAGALVGGAVAGLPGALVGAAIGALVFVVVGLAITWRDDEIFAPELIDVDVLFDPAQPPAGPVDSAFRVPFQDFGGDYEVGGRWHVQP